MPKPAKTLLFAGFAALAALSSTAANSEADEISSGLKADIIGTALGFSFTPWGNTWVIEHQHLALATGLGPRGNLCRFEAFYRPFNKGRLQSGPFQNRVFRDNTLVNVSNHNLAPGSTDGWHKFTIELPSGLSGIRVVMDANQQVDESDENNVFAVTANVKVDCGAGIKGRLPKAVPAKPTEDTAKRSLKLKSKLKH